MIMLLLLSSLMPHRLRPGIFGRGPGAIRLNCDVVGATANAEETILTPVGTPGVSHEPEWLAILLTITDDTDIVDDLHITSVITVDASSVVIESLGDGDTAGQWTSLVQLLFHGLFACDGSEFIDTIDEVLIRHETRLTWATVTAHGHS